MIIVWNKSCVTNVLLSTIVHYPIEKSHWLFVQGTRVMLTSGLTNKICWKIILQNMLYFVVMCGVLECFESAFK